MIDYKDSIKMFIFKLGSQSWPIGYITEYDL